MASLALLGATPILHGLYSQLASSTSAERCGPCRPKTLLTGSPCHNVCLVTSSFVRHNTRQQGVWIGHVGRPSVGAFSGRKGGAGVILAAVRKEAVAVKGEEELDEDMRVGLNEVSNEAIRVMLSEDIQALYALKQKVDHYGEWLAQENELAAARFMLVIRTMLDHQLAPEHEELTGAYKKAYEKICAVIEDSGWMIAAPGQEGGGTEMIDDDLLPPVLGQR